MRVLCASFGTRGDVAPFVALGLGLRARGHEVTVCGPPDHAWAGRYLPFVPAGDPYLKVVRELEAGPGRVISVMARQVPSQFAALAPLVAEADVVLSGSMEYATATLCEVEERPRRAVLLSPCMVPRRDAAMPIFPAWVPRWAAAYTWALVDLASGGIRRLVDAERRSRGLPAVSSLLGHLLGDEVLLPFPAALARVEAPLRGAVRQLGPWLLPPEPLPARVERFLAAGEPPVFVGLGSMPGVDEGVLRAAGRGRRTVYTGPGEDSDDTCFVGELSHAALFPRCAVVVHHGGAGTTLTALRAGRPQVVLPRTADQPFHARLIEEHGWGTALPRRGVSAERLVEAVGRVSGRVVPPLQADGVSDGVGVLEGLGGHTRPR